MSSHMAYQNTHKPITRAMATGDGGRWGRPGAVPSPRTGNLPSGLCPVNDELGKALNRLFARNLLGLGGFQELALRIHRAVLPEDFVVDHVDQLHLQGDADLAL